MSSRNEPAPRDANASPAEPDHPNAHFLTFSTYGSRLHGDPRGSVARNHNVPGTPFLEWNALLENTEFFRLKHSPVTLNPRCRAVVHRTIEMVCDHYGWTLEALNVRTNHVHVVVRADLPAKRVMNALPPEDSSRRD